MPLLTFSALLFNHMDKDIEMKDVPNAPEEPLYVEIPLDFDFGFELNQLTAQPKFEIQFDTDADELRSPRTPTYDGKSCFDIDTSIPFDPDKYLTFPILSPPQTNTPTSTPQDPPQPPVAKARTDMNLVNIEVKENRDPEVLPVLPSPPKNPLLWIWTCHLCRSRYPLGATRRCLVDGHYYCSGDNSASTQKNVKRRKRGQACSSEFDYVGWEDWAVWKHKVTDIKRRASVDRLGVEVEKRPSALRGCVACEFPSQCRYKRMNKIPEVIATVSQSRLDGGLEKQEKQEKSARTTAKTELRSKKEQKLLKVETGVTAGQRHSVGSIEPVEVTSASSLLQKQDAASRSKEMDGQITTHIGGEEETSREPSSPRFHDLVDFSSM